MHKINLISRRIHDLVKLADKDDCIFLTDLRTEFRPDLQNFLMGETLSAQNGKIVIGKNIYKRWLHKIKTNGFDYDVKFI
ncbi:MAG: hypothetical protein EOO88_04355 [Pedobacter sp.]|nr:MAG: hypothetical protein EOO88_04355 [Pedobacter sp.]